VQGVAQLLIAEPRAANRCTPEVGTELEQLLMMRACGDADGSPTIDLGDRQSMIPPHSGHDVYDVFPQGTATPRQRSHRPGPRQKRRARRRPPRSALSIVLLSSNLPISPSSLSGGATLSPHGGYPHDRERAPPTRLYRFLLHDLVLLMRGPPSSLMHPGPSAENSGKHATDKLGAPRERTATPKSASENRSPGPWCLPPCGHALPLDRGHSMTAVSRSHTRARLLL